MLGGIRVGKLVGIPFFINPSWFLVFGLVTYSLASGQLPLAVPGRQEWVYWLLGALTALLFFGSLVAHEVGHSVVSKAYGIPVRSITLHLFGGVAQLGREVRRAREEFWIALAGPAVSLALGALFWGGRHLLRDTAPTLGTGLEIVAVLNIGVVIFNMVPGFPLDGGRVLRAVVWGISGNYRKSTRVAATGGRLIGLLFIAVGLYLALAQNDLSSLWLALVGWFLINIARQSYAQAVVQDTLQKTPVSQVMVKLLTVPSHLTLDELFAGYISTTGWQYYLVEKDGRPVGLLTTLALARVPRPLWPVTPLLTAMSPLESVPQVSIASSAVDALYRIEESRAEMLLVVDNGSAAGVVTRDRLFNLSMRATAA